MAVRERFDFDFAALDTRFTLSILSLWLPTLSRLVKVQTLCPLRRGEGGVHQDSSLTSHARQ